MIYTEVQGCKSSSLKKELIIATNHFLGQLNVTKKTKPLDIIISLTNSDADGFCDYNYDDKYPEIYIELDKSLSRNELLIALAHELVHAKQFLRKELKTKDGLNYWKGAIYSNMGFNTTTVPWEQEAYLKETTLFNNYDRQKKNFNII
jgi:hypothetical protein